MVPLRWVGCGGQVIVLNCQITNTPSKNTHWTKLTCWVPVLAWTARLCQFITILSEEAGV